MSVGRFFPRVHTAVGRHLAIDSATLEVQLGSTLVAVECAPPSERARRWTAELLVNQLARLYPRLCVFGDPDVSSECRALAQTINPSIELADDPEHATFTVSLSPKPRSGSLNVSSRDWTVFVGGDGEEPETSEPNAFAAAAASAIAASVVFRRVVLNQDITADPPLRWNLMSLRHADDTTWPMPRVDVGHSLLAGVGAVGNASLWCLARYPDLRGRLTIVEPETVELSNLQRYVLARDADIGVDKTTIAERALATSGLHVESMQGKLGEIDVPTRIDHLVVTVDNRTGRRIAQALLPRIVVNGWTSATGLGASVHDFREGAACLACLYHPAHAAPSQTEMVAQALGLDPKRAADLWLGALGMTQPDVDTIAAHFNRPGADLADWSGKRIQDCYQDLVCGSAAVPVHDRDNAEIVPLAHQSVLAGILAASELIKSAMPDHRGRTAWGHMIAWHDITRVPPLAWTQTRGQEPGCICLDETYRDVYARKWGSDALEQTR